MSMNLEQAIDLLKKTVKNNSTTNTNHIDLGLVSAQDRPIYEKALAIVKLAILEGKMSQEEFANKVNL